MKAFVTILANKAVDTIVYLFRTTIVEHDDAISFRRVVQSTSCPHGVHDYVQVLAATRNEDIHGRQVGALQSKRELELSFAPGR